MTDTKDIRNLCALIDQGDDAALPLLADAMEEAGDPRAAILRGPPYIGHYIPVPADLCAWRETWYYPDRQDGGRLAMKLRDLGGVPCILPHIGGATAFHSRSAAFLALAAALA